jgi:hypothetical protein
MKFYLFVFVRFLFSYTLIFASMISNESHIDSTKNTRKQYVCVQKVCINRRRSRVIFVASKIATSPSSAR